jgi:SAM-dependent methyltransferase
MNSPLRPAVLAFDAAAPTFDSRFGAWSSVAAQRRAVRSALLRRFPPSGRLLEVGGGTGEDAVFLAERGFDVLLTDPSPTMVKLAAEKLVPLEGSVEIAGGEEMEVFAERYLSAGRPLFDGVFSNFAPLNCVSDLDPIARGLAQLLKPGGAAILVLFGTCCPGEMLVETFRGRPGQAFRRCKRGAVLARLAKQEFEVVYHRSSEIKRAFDPWFVLEKRIGIGVTVPPAPRSHGYQLTPSCSLRWKSATACLPFPWQSSEITSSISSVADSNRMTIPRLSDDISVRPTS